MKDFLQRKQVREYNKGKHKTKIIKKCNRVVITHRHIIITIWTKCYQYEQDTSSELRQTRDYTGKKY